MNEAAAMGFISENHTKTRAEKSPINASLEDNVCRLKSPLNGSCGGLFSIFILSRMLMPTVPGGPEYPHPRHFNVSEWM